LSTCFSIFLNAADIRRQQDKKKLDFSVDHGPGIPVIGMLHAEQRKEPLSAEHSGQSSQAADCYRH
jgi:hypothetical protein